MVRYSHDTRRLQVSERMRLGHEAALLTEAKEAAEAASSRTQAELRHLQERIAILTSQLMVRLLPCLAAADCH